MHWVTPFLLSYILRDVSFTEVGSVYTWLLVYHVSVPCWFIFSRIKKAKAKGRKSVTLKV